MKIIEANRLNKVSEYYFSKKLREINEINQSGIKVINLGIGSPDLEPPKVVINELTAWSNQNNVHGYQRYNGIPELRLAIKQWCKKVYDIDLNADNEILPLMGSKEGIHHITQAFVNKGDKVLVPMLGYPTYRSVSNLAQAMVVEYSIKSDGNFDLDELSSLLSGNTKVLWLNYPHMPTGTPANKKAITELIALANENGCIVINDNPYSTLLTDDYFSIFQIDRAKENCLELNSLSKSHNMSGWRIGWVSGKTELIQSILKIKSNMDSGMFLPIQKAAISALNVSTDWIKQLNFTYSERRKVVWKILDKLDCSYSKDKVGLFVWASIPDKYISAEIWINEILYKAKVFITPGFIFGSSGNKFIRVSLCNTTEILREALNRINNLK
ncbi:MAG: aminotransferase class I/II-fold pyridoxal phosphate-dependent enzyme [Bacteroidetes bacterium]|nr:aminotransferase class I/II-fold pyridoxal phosphate-dependent enzyme [Bacteroidota bacterium]